MSRSSPEIDYLLDAFNSMKDAKSLMVVTWNDGKFDVYFHGEPKEVAMAMKCVADVQDVVDEYNILTLHEL